MRGSGDSFWALALLRNVGSYSALVLPFYAFFLFCRHRGLIAAAESQGSQGPLLQRLVLLLFVEKPQPLPATADAKAARDAGGRQIAGLAFCFGGLMLMYLTWGLMQEKMMTQKYTRLDDPSVQDKFSDSQFLVFVNRISAFALSLALILANSYPPLRAPLYKFSYASLSNVMSSWFQYEALKHIIFPVQVLGKSFKIVPVMLMSRCVSGTTFAAHEYATSALISVGCGLFLFSQGGGSAHKKLGDALDIHGLILMAGYIAFDSFTSNWQADLKRKYDVHKLQLMCGVNLFSTVLTLFSLAVQGTLLSSLDFVWSHAGMGWDVVLLAACGAVGQLFIFETITRFGAVVFTIMMTIRQAAAIFLSCLWYGHELRPSGVIGVLIVTAAVLAKPYLSRRFKAPKHAEAAPQLKEEKI